MTSISRGICMSPTPDARRGVQVRPVRTTRWGEADSRDQASIRASSRSIRCERQPRGCKSRFKASFFLSAKINLSRSIHNDGPAASDATNRKWWKRLRRRILSRRSVCARCIGTDANAGYWRRCDDLGIKISPRAVVEDGLPQRLQETRVAMRSQA